jgi:hypothetical protein
MVHALCGIYQNHFGMPARAGMLGEVNHLACGFDPNFFAGLALFVVDLFLRFFVQRPIQFQCHGLGHEHAQIRV